ncbi:MAG: hypothetical protein JXA97_06805 [Anaerolineales bacterium]|nr:hypothetical protein [Anaerolineales bacterium]
MSGTYLPPVKHVSPLNAIRRVRKLPVPGTVTVRVNEKVQAADVLAEAEVRPRHVFIDIARALGVPSREIGRHLACEKGDRVEAGDILAGPVGLPRRIVRAPADGRVMEISQGRVLFQQSGKIISLTAGFPGTVVTTDGIQTIMLEATGALVQASWGNGQEDFGVMRMIGEGAADRLQTDKLDVNLRGAVLIAGTCQHPGPLKQAHELAVRGIILGSAPSELIPLMRRLPFPILILEGFGEVPINPTSFNMLSTNIGREVCLNARNSRAYESQCPEVIIPLPATKDVDLPDDVFPLKNGVRVRLLRSPYFGESGIIREVLDRAVQFPSGILAHSVRVELSSGGTVTVPMANLEVIQ